MLHKSTMIAALCLSASMPVFAQTTWHVDASAPPGGDGQSWATALNALDLALLSALSDDRVWVAAGVYRPRLRTNPGEPRSASFRPPPGVRMWGGFDGSETLLSQRAGLYRQTILDGDIGVAGVSSDNAWHVVRLEGNGALHVVDGFTIQGGNATPDAGVKSGGGVYSILGIKHIRNCSFRGNHAVKGGAIQATAGKLYLEDCVFEGNSTFFGGGAIRAAFDVLASNCVFRDNWAGGSGGALLVTQSIELPDGTPRPVFQNCLFENNSANRGGAIYLDDGGVTNTAGQARFSGCTIVNNHAVSRAGGVGTPSTFHFQSDCRIWNSIIWNNTAPSEPEIGGHAAHLSVTYSDVSGGFSGAGIIDADPLFRNPSLGRYSLLAGSPCIDAADNNAVISDVNDLDGDGVYDEPTPLDILGLPRFVDDPGIADTGAGAQPITDMGCVEFQP